MNDPEFRARLSAANRSELLYLLSYIKKFNEQVVLSFSDDGLRIQVADPAHVAMLNVCVSRNFFTTLVAHGEIGVNVGLFHKIIGMMDGDTLFEYDAQKAKLRVSDADTVFEMACFVLDCENFEFPEEEIAQMNPIELLFGGSSQLLIDTVKQWAGKFGADSVRFDIEDDRLTLSAETIETTIQKTVSIMGSKNWAGKFNTRYLTQLQKTDNDLVLSWRHDFPLMIEERAPFFVIQTFIAPMMTD